MKMPWEKNNVQDPRVTNILRWISTVSASIGVILITGITAQVTALFKQSQSIENKLMIIEERTKNIAANDAQQDRLLEKVITITQDLQVQDKIFKMEIRQLRENRR